MLKHSFLAVAMLILLAACASDGGSKNPAMKAIGSWKEIGKINDGNIDVSYDTGSLKRQNRRRPGNNAAFRRQEHRCRQNKTASGADLGHDFTAKRLRRHARAGGAFRQPENGFARFPRAPDSGAKVFRLLCAL